MTEETIAKLRAAGFDKEADIVESVTPEQEAEFERWLAIPANRTRWDLAIEMAREKDGE
jgi:hypothetical protein